MLIRQEHLQIHDSSLTTAPAIQDLFRRPTFCRSYCLGKRGCASKIREEENRIQSYQLPIVGDTSKQPLQHNQTLSGFSDREFPPPRDKCRTNCRIRSKIRVPKPLLLCCTGRDFSRILLPCMRVGSFALTVGETGNACSATNHLSGEQHEKRILSFVGRILSGFCAPFCSTPSNYAGVRCSRSEFGWRHSSESCHSIRLNRPNIVENCLLYNTAPSPCCEAETQNVAKLGLELRCFPHAPHYTDLASKSAFLPLKTSSSLQKIQWELEAEFCHFSIRSRRC